METSFAIDKFGKKIELLIKKYQQLKTENDTLAKENTELKQKLAEKEIEIQNTIKENNKQQLTNTFLAASGNNPQDAKNKINKIVREIDNCIALLNR